MKNSILILVFALCGFSALYGQDPTDGNPTAPLYSLDKFRAERLEFSKWDKRDIKKAKKEGDLKALGFIYLDNGFFEEGIPIVKQAIAKGNCEDCEYQMAMIVYKGHFPRPVIGACYRAGDSIRSNYREQVIPAIAKLRKLDRQGVPMASYHLAYAFERSQIHLGKKEIDSALYYYQKAANQGYPPAMSNLAKLYHYGGGSVTRKSPAESVSLVDLKKARYWHNEVAKLGDKESIEIVALFDKAASANAFDKGYEAFEAKKYDEAYAWWKASAKIDQEGAACYNLGIIHLLGKAPEHNYKDYDGARVWFQDACHLDYAKGCFYAGKMNTEFGRTAMEYYQKAADLGYEGALEEKQKIQDYADAVIADRKKSAEEYLAKVKKDYENFRAPSSTPMPNNNIQQATYSSTQSEAQRHQQEMDKQARDTEKLKNGTWNGH